MNQLSIILVCLCLIVVCASFLGAYYSRKICKKFKGTSPSTRKSWSHTVIFDDGPWTGAEIGQFTALGKDAKALALEDRNALFLRRILQAVKQDRRGVVRYIFCLNGCLARKYSRDIVNVVKDNAHIELCNHSYNHLDQSKLSPEDAYSDFQRTQRELREATGQSPLVYQFPFLSRNEKLASRLGDEGIEVLENSCTCSDYSSTSGSVVLDKIKALLQLGHRTFTLHTCKATSEISESLPIFLRPDIPLGQRYGGDLEELRNDTVWQVMEDKIFMYEHLRELGFQSAPVLSTTLTREGIPTALQVLRNVKSYVVKANHFSGTFGIHIVVDGTVMKKMGGPKCLSVVGEDSSLEKVRMDALQIWDFPWKNCPAELSVPAGLLVEEYISDPYEVKIHCVWGKSYWHQLLYTKTPGFTILSNAALPLKEKHHCPWMGDAIELAEKFTLFLGIDYLRVDVRRHRQHCCISEVTRCGKDINEGGLAETKRLLMRIS